MASSSKTDKAALKILEATVEGDLRALKNAAKKLGKDRGTDKAIARASHCCEDDLCALHIAAATGRTNICQYLIEDLGFDSNLVTDAGHSPIFHATWGSHINTARYLLDHGANPIATDEDGFTPVRFAVLQGDAEILDLLLSRGDPTEAKNIAGTLLILAACQDDDSCMKVLVDHNADFNKVSDGFFTPLFFAVANDSIKCVEVLLKAGADVNNVPLLEMAFNSAKLLDYLLEAGADANTPNEYGRLPIEIAAVRGKREVVERLYPLTSPIPNVSDWSIDGMFRHVESPIYHIEEEAQSKKRLERLKRKAYSEFSHKEYIVAIFLCTYAMSENPYDATIHANRSLFWLHLNHGMNALIDATNCCMLRPEWPRSYLCLGSALSCLKEHETACLTLVKGLSLDPTNREIQKALKQALERKSNNARVIHLCKCNRCLTS